jgi:hypothetical protein
LKSVTDYFRETYGYIIRHPLLPCLQVGNQQRPNYLPIEVCKIVEGQRYSKRLNERQITALLKVTCQRPKDREEDILQVWLRPCRNFELDCKFFLCLHSLLKSWVHFDVHPLMSWFEFSMSDLSYKLFLNQSRR